MAYQLLPNLILVLCIVGLLLLVLRRLPEASSLDQQEADAHAEPQVRLLAKGLPARAASRSRAIIQVAAKRVWHFMLEAKGLRQGPAINYRMKKTIGHHKNSLIFECYIFFSKLLCYFGIFWGFDGSII